ncbi:MAG TPA: hypothetical protein VN222_12265 [Novosphingobium sp.]|nr:hypothetical protein [Novosphingobium sp.]
MQEYRALPALVAAARPDRLVLAWTDRPLPVPPQLRGEVEVLAPAEAHALALRALGEGYGLPAALGLRGGQVVCRPWRGPLSAREIAEFRRGCP